MTRSIWAEFEAAALLLDPDTGFVGPTSPGPSDGLWAQVDAMWVSWARELAATRGAARARNLEVKPGSERGRRVAGLFGQRETDAEFDARTLLRGRQLGLPFGGEA